ncbi:MAG TPA: aquaporin [Patescibacteria group bacterium]|nr:aquaporin [Patescibacteria group bacterium]
MQNSKYLAEFIGTFFLVTVVAFTGNPLAIGAVLMTMVYVFGHVSGAHFNPAVTFAFWLKKKMTGKESLYYVLSQFLGALVAGIFYSVNTRSLFLPEPALHVSFLWAVVIEAIFTFLLVNTILHTAADKRVKGNQYFGLAIGAALFIGATIGGPISGGVFNPAVGIAPWLLSTQTIGSNLSVLFIYLCGPLLGALAASAINDK